MPILFMKSGDDNAANIFDPETASAPAATAPARFIGMPEVLARVGVISYPTIWQWMRDGKFPRSRDLGGKVAWVAAEIDNWIVSRPVRRLKGDK